MQKRYPVLVALATAVVLIGLLTASLLRLHIDTDIINSLPVKDPVLADARYVLTHHPFQNQIAVDLYLPVEKPDRLAAAADAAEALMRTSGLFEQVGLKRYQQSFPELIATVGSNLPMLFSAGELQRHVAPMLSPAAVRHQMAQTIVQLSRFEGIGQADLLDKDPLGLRRLVLARLAHTAPVRDTRLYRGHLMSADRRHVLIIAKPAASGTDTDFARQLERFFQDLPQQLNPPAAADDPPVDITPMGAYRAALDNERTARRDMQRVIALSTIGIAMLLVFTFPRPYLGLLSLLPALAGTVGALFVFSLFHRAISILTLAFGGAVISITVDHGITYLLFLDRPYRTHGRDAAKEVWSIGLLAVLTTVGAFSILSVSGYAVLNQIGQFAALGISVSFLFVHTVFPHLMVGLPPAGKDRSAGIQRFLTRVADWGGWRKAAAAGGLAVLMAFWATPEYNNDFRAMNTVSADTRAAEQWVSRHWRSFADRLFLTSSAEDPLSLQRQSDRLLTFFEGQVAADRLQSAFTPSLLFPGPERGRSNFTAWRTFWHPERVDRFTTTLRREAAALGFAADAFAPFIQAIRQPVYQPTPIPESVYPLLGITRKTASEPAAGRWLYSTLLSPGPDFDSERFAAALSRNGLAKVFDPDLFSKRLGRHLAETFQQMVVIIGTSVAVLVFVFFMDWQLAAAALLPVVFAFVTTLGTLNLLGHPLDIPGLMLSIVILGMGIDYTLFLVRARQRYRLATDPSTALVRLAVFLASASTLIGFGTLNFAGHHLLRSAGLTCFLGIAYSLIGAYTILPPILNRLFPPASDTPPMSRGRSPQGSIAKRVYRRYRHMAASIRLAVLFKLRLDPFYQQLPPMVAAPQTILLLGTGRGETAAWLTETYPMATVLGVEPNAAFRRITGHALGGDITLFERFDALPAIPQPPVDLVVVDEGRHRIAAAAPPDVYRKLKALLAPGGYIWLRTASTDTEGERTRQRSARRQVTGAGSNRNGGADRFASAVLRAGLRIDAVQRCGQDRLIVIRHGNGAALV